MRPTVVRAFVVAASLVGCLSHAGAQVPADERAAAIAVADSALAAISRSDFVALTGCSAANTSGCTKCLACAARTARPTTQWHLDNEQAGVLKTFARVTLTRESSDPELAAAPRKVS